MFPFPFGSVHFSFALSRLVFLTSSRSQFSKFNRFRLSLSQPLLPPIISIYISIYIFLTTHLPAVIFCPRAYPAPPPTLPRPSPAPLPFLCFLPTAPPPPSPHHCLSYRYLLLQCFITKFCCTTWLCCNCIQKAFVPKPLSFILA